jgi:NADPH-dependent 7-cyano-7-deazaguanine reductase QueF
MLRRTGYHSDHYLFRYKIFLSYRHSGRNSEEEGEQNTEKIKKKLTERI